MIPLETLYEQAFPPVARMVRRLGGDQETAREQQRAELNSVYEHLMRKPSFREKILAIFK